MELPYITTISLIWFIYITLLSESDREILDVFNRLKFSISINEEGILDKIQLDTKLHLGIPEVFNLAETINSDHIYVEKITKFKKYYLDIQFWKKILLGNLFLLTIHSVIYTLGLICLTFTIPLHIIISLFLSIYFYWKSQSVKELSFTKFYVKD